MISIDYIGIVLFILFCNIFYRYMNHPAPLKKLFYMLKLMFFTMLRIIDNSLGLVTELDLTVKKGQPKAHKAIPNY